MKCNICVILWSILCFHTLKYFEVLIVLGRDALIIFHPWELLQIASAEVLPYGCGVFRIFSA